jgi:hypothetical protein
MKTSDYQPFYDYLAENVITPFYNKRFSDLQALKLKAVLKRKNPYLFKAKNIELAQDLVKGILDAYLSSQEETIFGDLLEGFAIFVSQSLYNGFKSKLKSVDLEFQRSDIYYIVGIKSGPNWGNSDQINQMKNNFKIAKKLLHIQEGIPKKIVAVNGCIYGKDKTPFKKDKDRDKCYFKYCGQLFWEFISEDSNLYREIIVPIDQEAKQKDENFKTAYIGKINAMTQEFMDNFMTRHQIDWVKFLDFVSKND